MTRKETERGRTERRCDDWVVDFPPEWNHMELTSQRSPFCPSVSRCSLEVAAEGSGTERRSQVHTERFDRVALTPEPGGEGTGRGGKKKGKMGWRRRKHGRLSIGEEEQGEGVSRGGN